MTMEINYKENERVRVFGLDILRSIAITLVVLVHGSYLLVGTRFEGFPFIKTIDGVDLFFVLSGYLIGGILLKEINATESFGIVPLRNFWKRRWLRTLPNYYLILILNVIIVYFKIIKEDIHEFNWKFVFFLQNFAKPFYDFFWESWSLPVEEWFYISSPLLLLLFLKFFSPKKSFILVTLLMISLPFIYRICILNPLVDNFWYDVLFHKIVITRLDSIAYGLLAAWVYYYYKKYWTKFKLHSLIAGIVLIVFIVNYKSLNSSFYKQAIYLSIAPVSAMLLLPFAQSIKTSKNLIGKAITHVSKISYSMYLINLALVSEVIRDNFPPTGEADGIIKYILYWLIVIVASTLLYTYFEKPIMNLRDR